MTERKSSKPEFARRTSENTRTLADTNPHPNLDSDDRDDDYDLDTNGKSDRWWFLRSKDQLFSKKRLKKFLHDRVPFVFWIRHYAFRKNLLFDVIAGITVFVIHVPQGLAYSQLADCPPIVGIYMSIFPAFMYIMFGTSRHCSFGSVALICLMADATITSYLKYNPSSFTRLEVGTAVSFLVGVLQVAMFVIHFDIVCILMSKTFINSFMSGALVHVFTSQVKELLGIQTNKFFGVFGIVRIYSELITRMHSTNWLALCLSMSTIMVLIMYSILVKPRILKRWNIILPIECLVMVIAGVLSYTYEFEKNFGIRVIGSIPKGFPLFKFPPHEVFPYIVVQCLVLTIVSYFISISVALMFSREKNYKIDTHQELLAIGLANIFGSMLSCLPACASISRSLIQERSGGVSQITSFVAACALIIVLFFLGSLLKPLPRCVLAGIIVASVINVLFRCAELKHICRLSHREVLIWCITFLSVIFLGIDIGMAFGLAVSVLANIARSSDPFVCLVGRVRISPLQETERFAYVTLKQEIGVEVLGIKVIRIYSPITFLTQEYIVREVHYLSGLTPGKIMRERKKNLTVTMEISEAERLVDEIMKVTFKVGNPDPSDARVASVIRKRLRLIVIDATFTKYIDYSGIWCLETIASSYRKIGISVIIVSNNPIISKYSSVRQTINKAETVLNS